MPRFQILFAVGLTTFVTASSWSCLFHRDAVLALLTSNVRQTLIEAEDQAAPTAQRAIDWTRLQEAAPKPQRGTTPDQTKTPVPTHTVATKRTAEQIARETATLRQLTASTYEPAPNMGMSGPKICATKKARKNDGTYTRYENRIELLSKTYEVDKIYKSMQGPWGEDHIPLLDSPTPELVWITGVDVRMFAADGETPMPEHFMCHTNFDLNMTEHNQLLGLQKMQDGRMFTLSQGQLSVQFPSGTGIPMMSTEAIRIITQALNLNFDHRAFQVRHKVNIHFVRDAECLQPMLPLYECGVSSLKSLADTSLVYDYTASGNLANSGPLESMCLPGEKASSRDESTDRNGNKFTGHWIVKPGREVNRTRVTTIMNLPFDTRAHYIAVHVHPFAESLELRDITANETVFKSLAHNYIDLIGLDKVDYISSEEGIPLYKDHEYELISVYNNPTQNDTDSMAVFYMYLFDPEFQKPVLAKDAIR